MIFLNRALLDLRPLGDVSVCRRRKESRKCRIEVPIGTKSYRASYLAMTPEQRVEHIVTRSAILLEQLEEIRVLREQVHQAQAGARHLNIQEIRTTSKD